MTITPTTQTEALKVICDELLSATGQLRHAFQKAGAEWPNSEIKDLINRLLDVRNQVSPPTKAQNKY